METCVSSVGCMLLYLVGTYNSLNVLLYLVGAYSSLNVLFIAYNICGFTTPLGPNSFSTKCYHRGDI